MYCLAEIQFAQYERKDENSCYLWFDELSNLTLNVMKEDSGDSVDILLCCQLSHVQLRGHAQHPPV